MKGGPWLPNRRLIECLLLRWNSSLFLDAYTGVHLGLYGITSSRDELGVVSFNGLDGIGKHLGNREDVNTSSQHVADERIVEAVG